jgi:hypothetical protein
MVMQGASTPQDKTWWQASDGQWYPPHPPQGQTMAVAPGGTEDGPFFRRLLDFSFTSFVTPSIVKVLFGIAVVVISLVTAAYAILIIGVSLNQGGSNGTFVALLTMVLAPLVWILQVIYARVFMELVVVLFRIERNTRVR